MILGTAGHVDHGKTALVKALTGVDTDRLKEEKLRGITVELGFAHLQLDDGSIAGVVDVPGHDQFVKEMAAGAGGIDIAILVVAMDEGVMPQTREHLDICRLLGVRAGVIALTKSDLLSELGASWLDLLKADLAGLTEGTFLEAAPLIPCSARTGEGIAALRAELTRLAAALPKRATDGPTFLPIDRAFTLKGFGTVVTGPMLSGSLAIDDQVSLVPGLPGPLRVRSIQIHGKPAGVAVAGQRTAVNLVGVEKEAISRGLVLSRYEQMPATSMIDVELTLLEIADKPLPRRKKLLLHLGTAQVGATVALLDVEALAPGDSCLAQLRLDARVAALPHQRFILRDFRALPGRGATLAGGRVLMLTPPRRRKGAAALLRPMAEGGLDERLECLLRHAGHVGLTAGELFVRAAADEKAVAKSLEILAARGRALLIDKERRLFVAAEVFGQLVERSLVYIEEFHAREPMSRGVSTEELRRSLSADLGQRLFARILATLRDGGSVEVDSEVVRLMGRGRSLTDTGAEAKARVHSEVRAGGLGPPRVKELAQRLSLDGDLVARLCAMLEGEGKLCHVSPELFFDAGAVATLKERLLSHLQEHGEITTQAFKELVGQSRKFVIPLSEFFDRERVTLRVGERRVLRRG